MTLRGIGVFAATVLLIALPALAIESGKAEGTVTINRKPVKLKYAYAKKEQGRWTVVLTDRAVTRSVLNDSSRLSDAIAAGNFVAVRFNFNENKELDQTEVMSKALQYKQLPINSSDLKLSGLTFGAEEIEGGAATTEDKSFFTDVASLDAKFRAPLGAEGKFGEGAAAAKELAASAPKIGEGGAAGSMKVDGTNVPLTYAIARNKPNAFDEKKKDVVVLLTQKPVTAEMFAEESKLFAAAGDGSLQGLLVTIDQDEKPYHLQLLHPKAAVQVSGSGIFNFDATDFSDKRVAGKFYTTSEQEAFGGEHKYSYDVSFAVPVQKIVAPSEVTVDASTGTKLPANGGDPGKAYMAFDKASRAGNLNEMKKYASKTRPLPEMSAEEQKQMIQMMKLLRPAKVKVTGGFVSGDHATLTVEGEDPEDKAKMTGTIEMAQEGGAWKLLAEKWKR